MSKLNDGDFIFLCCADCAGEGLFEYYSLKAKIVDEFCVLCGS